MVNASLGSISDRVYARIDNIPTSISGAQMLQIIDEQRIFMEDYTSLTIGSVSIAERFQSALTDLSSASILEYMEVQGSDANSVTLGEFSITKGGESNTKIASDGFKEMGMMKLKSLGRGMRFNQVLG